MILSFGVERKENYYHGDKSAMRKYPPHMLRAVQRKLDRLHHAAVLGDMLFSPGNRLEALQGDWAGFHSVREMTMDAEAFLSKRRC
jgi:proteic killer suppression protein